jgi:hypothetical protein
MLSVIKHPAFIWLVVAMSLQGLIIGYLNLRGPAHFHLAHEVSENAHDHHAQFHGHDQVEHHHHDAGDETVVIVEDHSVIEAIAAEEGSAQGGSAKFAVLVLAGAPLHLPRMPNGGIASRDRQLKSRFPDRLERPPRVQPA